MALNTLPLLGFPFLSNICSVDYLLKLTCLSRGCSNITFLAFIVIPPGLMSCLDLETAMIYSKLLELCKDRDSPVAHLVMNLPAMWETWVWTLAWEDTLEKGNTYPLQYSGLENSMDCAVHGVAKSQTRLSDFQFHMQR